MSSSKTGEATPRPWVLHHPSGIRICDGAHESLGGCLSIAEAEILGRDRSESVSNAAFIVESVNSYDALQAENKVLREALRELVESIESSPKVSIGGIENVYQSQFFVKSISLAKARQALKGEE